MPLDYNDKLDEKILEGHTIPCPYSDGFGELKLKHPFIFVWFPKEICLIFHIFVFIERASELNGCYRLETDNFFDSTGKNTEKID